MKFLFAVAWRNLWRHRRRTLITAAAMGVGVALCMASIALQDGMYTQMFDVMVTDSLGHVRLHHPGIRPEHLHDAMDDNDGLREAIAGVDGVTLSAPRLFAFALAGGGDLGGGTNVGVHPSDEDALTGISEKLTTGDWLATVQTGRWSSASTSPRTSRSRSAMNSSCSVRMPTGGWPTICSPSRASPGRGRPPWTGAAPGSHRRPADLRPWRQGP